MRPWLALLALQFALGAGLGSLVTYLYLRWRNRRLWRQLDNAAQAQATVHTVRVRPGDVVAVRYPAGLDMEATELLHETVVEIFGEEQRVLFFEDDVSVSIVTSEENDR